LLVLSKKIRNDVLRLDGEKSLRQLMFLITEVTNSERIEYCPGVRDGSASAHADETIIFSLIAIGFISL
jgi:hypothetical protein